MSIAMGPVPSSPVAMVTWHVVGLCGGRQESVHWLGAMLARRIIRQHAGRGRALGRGREPYGVNAHTHTLRGHY